MNPALDDSNGFDYWNFIRNTTEENKSENFKSKLERDHGDTEK